MNSALDFLLRESEPADLNRGVRMRFSGSGEIAFALSGASTY
jgi:hypothetical protein